MKKLIFSFPILLITASCSSPVDCDCEILVTRYKSHNTEGEIDTTFTRVDAIREAEDGDCSQFYMKWENNNEISERICEPLN